MKISMAMVYLISKLNRLYISIIHESVLSASLEDDMFYKNNLVIGNDSTK